MNLDENEEQPSKAWLADGLAISQRVTIACLGLVLPLAAGYWIGEQAGYRTAGLIGGLMVGLIASGALLLDLVKWLNRRQARIQATREPKRPNRNSTTKLDGNSQRLKSDNVPDDEDPWQKRWEEKWNDDWEAQDESDT